MRAYLLDTLKDADLRRGLFHWGSQERSSTAMFIAHIAEFDRRKLHVPEGYASMFEYCIRVLKMSEGGTYRRIRAARAARRYPSIFEAIADGRLHLTAIVLLAPHLTHENHEELIKTAMFKNKSDIEYMLAERFPRPDVRTRISPCMPLSVATNTEPMNSRQPVESAASPVTAGSTGFTETQNSGLTLASVETPMISHISPEPARPASVAPLAPQRFALQVTVDQEFRDLLQEAQALLSHAIPSRDISQVLKRGLRQLVQELRRRKCGDVAKPRSPRSVAAESRTVPAHVRRAVWRRDGGQCAFVSPSGHRCEARAFLEFHHEHAFACGGEARITNICLRCRAHNQYEAEQVFGERFMTAKRSCR